MDPPVGLGFRISYKSPNGCACLVFPPPAPLSRLPSPASGGLNHLLNMFPYRYCHQARSCNFTNNNSSFDGGAILSTGALANVFLDRCRFTENTAGYAGGAVRADSALVVTVRDTVFTRNSATGVCVCVSYGHCMYVFVFSFFLLACRTLFFGPTRLWWLVILSVRSSRLATMATSGK